MEERGLRPEDWNDPLDYKQETQKFPAKTPTSNIVDSEIGKGKSNGKGGKGDSDEQRKMKLNAPKRIPKIETSIEKHNEELTKIDADMITVMTFISSS